MRCDHGVVGLGTFVRDELGHENSTELKGKHRILRKKKVNASVQIIKKNAKTNRKKKKRCAGNASEGIL
jgi:hypothetical protein